MQPFGGIQPQVTNSSTQPIVPQSGAQCSASTPSNKVMPPGWPFGKNPPFPGGMSELQKLVNMQPGPGPDGKPANMSLPSAMASMQSEHGTPSQAQISGGQLMPPTTQPVRAQISSQPDGQMMKVESGEQTQPGTTESSNMVPILW